MYITEFLKMARNEHNLENKDFFGPRLTSGLDLNSD